MLPSNALQFVPKLKNGTLTGWYVIPDKKSKNNADPVAPEEAWRSSNTPLRQRQFTTPPRGQADLSAKAPGATPVLALWHRSVEHDHYQGPGSRQAITSQSAKLTQNSRRFVPETAQKPGSRIFSAPVNHYNIMTYETIAGTPDNNNIIITPTRQGTSTSYALRQATTRPHGGDHKSKQAQIKVYNINLDPASKGTSTSYALLYLMAYNVSLLSHYIVITSSITLSCLFIAYFRTTSLFMCVARAPGRCVPLSPTVLSVTLLAAVAHYQALRGCLTSIGHLGMHLLSLPGLESRGYPARSVIRPGDYTQQYIADALGVPQTTVSYWLKVANVTRDILAKGNGNSNNGTPSVSKNSGSITLWGWLISWGSDANSRCVGVPGVDMAVYANTVCIYDTGAAMGKYSGVNYG